MRKLVVGAAVTAAALVGILAVTASPADAHASPVGSDPPDGAELAEAPDEISFLFNEPPELSVSTLQVIDAAGEPVEVGEVGTLPGNDRSLVVPVDDLPEGTYTAGWTVVSQVDGHTTSGAVGFGIGTAAAAVGATVEVPPLSWLETTGRLTLFTGLVPLVGVASVVPFAFGALVRRAHRRLAAAAGAVAVLGLVLLALAQRNATGAGLGTFLGTAVGQAIIWRAIGLGVMAGGLVVALRTEGRTQRTALVVTGLAAAATVAAHVATGHAAATATPALEVASQWVHVIAIGIWIGGLAVLLAGLRGLSREDRGRATRRFSQAAAIALGAVILTGTLRTVSELERVSELWDSPWGRGVLAKIVGVAVLAGLGAVNRYRHVPIATRSTLGLRRFGRGELTLSVFVLGAAAIVASTSPPAPTAAGETPEPVTVSGADPTTSVRAALNVDPAGVGNNEMSLRVADFDTDEPFADADVRLRFEYPENPSGVPESELPLEETDPGTYAATGDNLSTEGTWQVTALVQRDDFSAEVPLDEFEVSAPAPTDVNGEGEEPAAEPGELAVNLDDPKVTEVEEDGVTKYEIVSTVEGSLEGDVVQVWFEPPQGGMTELNIGFKDQAGETVAVSDPIGAGLTQTVGGDVAAGEVIVPAVTREGGGHGFASVDLVNGEWELTIEAQGVEPVRPLTGRLQFTIG